MNTLYEAQNCKTHNNRCHFANNSFVLHTEMYKKNKIIV